MRSKIMEHNSTEYDESKSEKRLPRGNRSAPGQPLYRRGYIFVQESVSGIGAWACSIGIEYETFYVQVLVHIKRPVVGSHR